MENMKSVQAFMVRINQYEQMEIPLLDGKEYKKIFSCFESLFEFHSQFYDELLRTRLQVRGRCVRAMTSSAAC